MRSAERSICTINAVFEIISFKCFRVANLTFLGHVTSLVTWSFGLLCAISYRCSICTACRPSLQRISRLKHKCIVGLPVPLGGPVTRRNSHPTVTSLKGRFALSHKRLIVVGLLSLVHTGDYSRRIRRESPFSATVCRQIRRQIVAVSGDYSRQCGQGFTVEFYRIITIERPMNNREC